MNAEARSALIERLGRSQHEITVGYVNRQLFETLRDEIVAQRPESDGTWLNSYQAMYAQSQVMLIRRLADSHRDKPDSIWWIIERIRRTPALASRTALIDMVVERRDGNPEPFILDIVNHDFDRLAGLGETPSDDAMVELQDRLRSAADQVVAYADRNIAHLDPRGPKHNLTFSELHQALDDIAAIANDVSVLLISSTTMFDLVAVEPIWTECFRPGLFPTPIQVAMWSSELGQSFS